MYPLRFSALVLLLLIAATADAQYAERPRHLPVADGLVESAAQIGNRLFIAGRFSRLSPPTGNAVVVDAVDGAPVLGAFPVFTGVVHRIVPDGLGGYFVAGDFTSAGGQPFARFARVRPDRTIDPNYRLAANGSIRLVAIAHGRIYIGGDFTTINGAARGGLAALEAATGRLLALGTGFNPSNDYIRTLAISASGIYVASSGAAGPGQLWGFDATSGSLLFARTLWVNALAATSQRVYVGAGGAARPVFAVDPRTGVDDPWAPALRFQPIYGSYGEYTSISSLLLDGPRLYISGYFRTVDGRQYLTAVDAVTGQPAAWRPEGVPSFTTNLTRVGPAIVTTFWTGNWPQTLPRIAAFNVDTAALESWDPQPYGSIHTLAAASDGVVIGGEFNGIGGVERGPIAAIDLDSGVVEPWTVSLPGAPFGVGIAVATDGTHLVASYGALDLGMGYRLHARIVGDRVAVVQNRSSGEPLLTSVSIADWSRHDLPTTLGPSANVTAMDAAGEVAYLAGWFSTVDGTRRDGLAAVNLITGALEAWNPSPDAEVSWVQVAFDQVWVAGTFRRIGAAWRRGVAALDPITGQASPWNPDVPSGRFQLGPDQLGFATINDMEVGPDGYVYLDLSGAPAATVSGRPISSGLVALSTSTGQRLPWRPVTGDWAAILPGCLLQSTGCLPPAISAPTALTVAQSGSSVTFTWTPPAGEPARTAVRLEAGSAEGASDLAQIDLPPGQTSFSTGVPRGSYFVRLRSVANADVSLPTADVSFVVGPPDVPAAPLDLMAVTEGQRLTLAWQPPSTGAPAGYLFEVGRAPGGRELAALSIAGVSTSLVLDAPAGRYYGRLVPLNANGRGPASSEVGIDVATTVGYCQQAPDAPQNLSVQVTGRTVTLTWQLSSIGAIVDTQRLFAGTGPGGANLGTIPLDASATRFVTTVPPGTYYVRVVATNGCGASPASNEVVVSVP